MQQTLKNMGRQLGSKVKKIRTIKVVYTIC